MSLGIYPYKLVPYEGLIRSIDFESIFNEGDDFFIARRISGKPEDLVKYLSSEDVIFKDEESILIDIFSEIQSLSMTIMGGGAVSTDMKFEQKGEAKEDWKGKTLYPFSFKGLVNTTENYFTIVYKAESLHNQPIRYQQKFEKKTDFEKNINNIEHNEENANILLKNFKKSNQYEMSPGQLQVKHKPTNLNYWHAELNLLPSDLLDPIKNTKLCDYLKKLKQKKENPSSVSHADLSEAKEKLNYKQQMCLFVWKTYLSTNFSVYDESFNKKNNVSFPKRLIVDKRIIKIKRIINKYRVMCSYKIIPIVNA